jgi:hypothetical protein
MYLDHEDVQKHGLNQDKDPDPEFMSHNRESDPAHDFVLNIFKLHEPASDSLVLILVIIFILISPDI